MKVDGIGVMIAVGQPPGMRVPVDSYIGSIMVDVVMTWVLVTVVVFPVVTVAVLVGTGTRMKVRMGIMIRWLVAAVGMPQNGR